MLLKKVKNPNKIKETTGDRIFHAFTTFFLILITVAVGYPVIYVVSSSFSSDEALNAGRVLFLPVDPTLDGYKFVFHFKRIWLGYRNSVFYTVFGVSFSMILNILAAYPLSRTKYQGRNVLMMIFFFTTMFTAGLIPLYIVKSSLGLVDNVWSILLASTIGVSNVIILRTAFRSTVPSELYDAAAIDGAGEFQTMMQIALPLVKATINTIMLYTAVGCWNEYFTSMIYLRNENLYPLQLFLRTILTTAESLSADVTSSSAQTVNGIQQIQYTLIVMATVPVLLLYFVVQTSFKKGVMIGSVKG